MLSNNKKLRFFAILTLLLALVSSVCFYGLVRPDANGQTHVVAQTSVVASEQQPLEKRTPQRLLSKNITESGMTGGRARGGTFQSPAAPAPSRSVPRNNPRTYSDYNEFPRSSYPRSYYPTPVPPTVIIPLPAPNPGYVPSPGYTTPTNGTGLDIGLVFLLLIVGMAVLPILFNYLRLGASETTQSAGIGSTNERLNDIVTITQLQIALVAQARELQQDLDRLTTDAKLDTTAGLSQMLQETVLALLRSPQYWTHVRAISQTLKNREAASRLFEQLSIEARSMFKTETLVNIGGQVRRQTVSLPEDTDPGTYIVVTLLVGTADDRPLFDRVHSAPELNAALRRLGGVSPDYLLVYELLWTPQDQADSLSREELLTQYPGLIQL